jgi:hypothetical protein
MTWISVYLTLMLKMRDKWEKCVRMNLSLADNIGGQADINCKLQIKEDEMFWAQIRMRREWTRVTGKET